ncbi:alkaline phosphatase [Thalassotalea ponticola]|uniref:alkaline phosphatase n=1 Tax=Thalassotalea ponticola TaxID=1523392 RepID=UPI0025B4702D|nr:alkaline phosphatase [Thalassotalea ponticola]MDN3653841.1 alkaline phosphatase [Thalassotalea ponticola]
MKRISLLLLASALTTSISFNAFSQNIKNVILLIGDGMGPQQVSLLETYARFSEQSIYQNQPTALKTLADNGVIGMSLTNPKEAIVVDSACSATMLAGGIMTASEVIGIDANGNYIETILEKAQRLGKATGLVSDTRLTHATPAAFAAHQAHRSLENSIAEDMINIAPDVMLAGGLRHFIPQSVNNNQQIHRSFSELTQHSFEIKSKRTDDKDLLLQAQQQGYQLAFNRHMLEQASGDKLLGLFANSAMMDGITYSQRKHDEQRQQPSLAEMTNKALDVLSKTDKGFFLMVEGGQIDWAGHSNDAGTMLHELIKFDETIKLVYEWAKQRTDTLVVVTADHETGGFGFSYSSHNVPSPEARSGKAFANRDYAPKKNFASLDILTKLYNQQKSYDNIFAEFKKLDQASQTASTLASLVNQYTQFPITSEQAERILARRPDTTNGDQLDRIYSQHYNVHLLGKAQSTEQNTVWGTGTHTHTPVPVFAWGPKELILPLSTLMHHATLGQYLQSQIK